MRWPTIATVAVLDTGWTNWPPREIVGTSSASA